MTPVKTSTSAALVRPVALHTPEATLSALVGEPALTVPRATVVALHGAGMSAGYFHGQAHPDLSLLSLAAQLGYMALSVDRPGYGRSAERLPGGQTLNEQADTVLRGLLEYAASRELGAGLFLLGHSFGGKLALAIAASRSAQPVLGIDVSGCGYRYAAPPSSLDDAGRHWIRHWGALRLYPPGTFTAKAAPVSSTPPRELREVLAWPRTFRELAPHVRAPVRFTFAEHETWWHHDDDAVSELRSLLAFAPAVTVSRLPNAGHNISLGWAARAYHLQALAFFESCLLERAVA